MIKIAFCNPEKPARCDYCGEVHTETIMAWDEDELCSGLKFSRRCARKFIEDLQKFLKLHPSGLT